MLSQSLLSLALLATQSFVTPTLAQNPTVNIQNGAVVGTTTMLPSATAVTNKFLGMPFAQSPPQRFGPPQPAASFPGPLMAQRVKPACIQQFMYPELMRNITTGLFNSPPPPAGESEDCLYINVYAPSTPPPPGGRAVMFWLFGGALQFGSGTLMAYDGSAFAAYQDVVLVTHNYRTNAFGFPGAPELPMDQRNLGFLDQRAALAWVQANIAAFGGDPKKVTIFGESAGAFSVDALITSFTTETAPFRGAILESGQESYFTSSRNAAGTEPWEQLIKALNCTGDVLACARAAPASTIKSIIEHQALGFTPTPDDVTLAKSPAMRRQMGQFAAVPILIGTNADEARIFELGQGDFDTYLNATFSKAPQIIPQIKEAYPVGMESGVNGGYDRISQVGTLAQFQCGSALMANQTAAQNVSTWRYYFNATFPNITPFAGLIGVYHSSEISLVFRTYPGGPVNPTTPGIVLGVLPTLTPPTAQQEALSSYINGAWASFAKNPETGPGWNKLGTYEGQDLGVLGSGRDGSEGTRSSFGGVQVAERELVDGPCQLLLPAFRAGTGNIFGLTGA